MRLSEIRGRAKAIGQACFAASIEAPKYGGFVRCYAEKGAEMALRGVAHLLPEEPLAPLDKAVEEICDDYGFTPDGRNAQAVRIAIKRGCEMAASGIETEGHDAEERHGAKHESPASEAGTPE